MTNHRNISCAIGSARARGGSDICPFGHAPFEILEVVVNLLKREPEREEAFIRVAGKISRETLATERGNFRGIGIKSRFHVVERRRLPTGLQRGPACAQVIGEGRADTRQRRFDPRPDVSGSGLMAARPIITRSWRNLSSVRNSGPVSGPTARPADRSCSASAPTAFICTKVRPMPS